MENLILSYERGKFLKKVVTKFSDIQIEKFVNNLDIWGIHFINGDVSQKVTALVPMVADLNLKVKTTRDGLIRITL